MWVVPTIFAYVLIAFMSWCYLANEDKMRKDHEALKAHYEQNMLLFQSALHRIRHLEEEQVKVIKFGVGETWEKTVLVYNDPSEAAKLGKPGNYHVLKRENEDQC